MKHCQQEMTVIQNAWPVVCNFGWLIEADRNARKGKRCRAEVLNFTARLEDNLFTIQKGMMNGSYVLGPYRKLWVYVPKKRLVMALDYPDRIVQWSLYLYLNPIYDRLFIEKWLKMGMKPREVADKLRVHVSTIYRELKRGAYDRLDGGTWEVKTAYSPDIAEEKYQAHLREKGPDLKIGNDHELANYIETTILDKDCSPAAVLGFAMIEGKKFKTSLSVPTIYKYIAKGLFLNLTQEELPRHGKKKHKYKKVKKNKSASRAPAGESIEQRPEEIDEREEFGHWEGDTVYSGKGKRKTTRALLTLTERKTRKEIIIAIPNRKAETVVKALDALERKLGARRFRAIFKSITFDNGTEFAAAEELERSCINKRLPRTKVYFCHPYSSWERGTNENTNGMIRRRFPKGTNFAAVTNAQIAQAENWINNYPRKILGYKSSEIVFRECLRELGIAA